MEKIKLLPLNIAARLYRLPKKWLLEEARAGRLPGVVVGDNVVFDREELALEMSKRARKNVKQHKEWVDANRIAELIGVRAQTVRQWARDGKIPCNRISSQIIRFDLEEVLSQLKKGNAP